jgi:SAM-dependent methyltransferase
VSWDGEAYQRRFDQLAARGVAVHGEADFVDRLGPGSVLDAGCGTGRVAGELARRGREVVGVDRDPSMIAVARVRAPGVAFVEADLCTAELGRRFAIVVMAGNVVLFTTPGTEEALVAGAARHLEPGGRLVSGFVLDGRLDVAGYDRFCEAAGLVLRVRYASWEGAPFPGDGSYALSVHVRPG